MKNTDRIQGYREFFDNYLDQATEKPSLIFNFADLSVFNVDLADDLLQHPEENLEAAQIVLKDVDLDGKENELIIRWKNLPKTQDTKIVDSRAFHLNKLLTITAEVASKSKVFVDRVSATFECPACGNNITILQLAESFTAPSACGCGRKGRFALVSKETTDIQELNIVDAVDHQEEGDMYQELTVLLKADLTSPKINRTILTPNTTINVVGYFEEVELTSRTGKQLRRMDKVFIANNIELAEDQRRDFYPTKKEIEEFKQWATHSEFYNRIVEGFSPTIYGHQEIKEALLLQLVGGVRKHIQAHKFRRGDIHIGLIGDPGQAKTDLILKAADLLPRSRFVSGKGTSAVGVGGGVKKNAFVEGYTADPGAMAMANKSIIGIDEIDKMGKDDLDALNNAMEQQFVTIDKGGVHAKFEAITRVLIGANPTEGRFTPYEPLAKQFGIKPSLLSRLDLVFPIQDVPDEQRDKEMAEFILNVDSGVTSFEESKNPFYNVNTLRKYIQAVKDLKPTMPEEIKKELINYYTQMRFINNGDESQVSVVAITPRQLQALQRLSEASAKLFFRSEVTREDTARAIRLMNTYLDATCKDPDTGKIDIDRIGNESSSSMREHMHMINSILDELTSTIGKKIPIDDVIEQAKKKKITDAEVEEVLDRLMRNGQAFSPKPGFIIKY